MTPLLHVAEDETRQFGHALITFPRHLGGSSFRLSITRKFHDTPCLGAEGWQARPATVAAKIVSRTSDSTTVVVGPEVCDLVPLDLQVRIEVEGQGISGHAFWPAVAPSMGKWTSALTDTPPPPPPPLVSITVEELLPLPPKPASSPRQPLPPKQTPPPRKKSSRNLYLIAMLLLAAGTLFAADRMGWIGWPSPIEVESFASRFERLTETDADGGELFALSEAAYRGGDREIGFKAIDLARERGQQEAKLQLARWYDPRSFDSHKVDRADANKAGRYYFELSIVENARAAKLLASLCDESRKGHSPYADAFDGFLRNTYCEGNMPQ